jgi:hypothetical protein
MGKVWEGRSFDEDWHEIDAMGNRIGDGKDWAANAGYAAANNTQNPYTNQAGSSPWDKSGLIPGNEPGSTLAPVTGGGGTGSGGATAGLDKAVMDKLMSEIALDGKVDQNDPVYRQGVDTHNFQSDRAADRARAAAAQRMAATGTATGGGLDSMVTRNLENQRVSDQGFEADLLGKFRDQNLERAARALTLGTGVMTAQQERDLRALLTREGYGLQERLGNADLNFRRDALGQQAALSQAQLDQQALLALLG